MAVHSAQLASKPGLVHTQVTLYTVPTGKRTIVKSILVRNQAAAAQQVVVYVYDSGSAIVSMGINVAASGASGDTNVLQPWVVMNEGQQLRAIAGSASADLLVSGTELVL